jgi:hypothetical protein
MKRLLAVLAMTMLAGTASAAGLQDWVNVVHMADTNGDGMVSHSEVMDFHDAKAPGFQPFMINHWNQRRRHGQHGRNQGGHENTEHDRQGHAQGILRKAGFPAAPRQLSNSGGPR